MEKTKSITTLEINRILNECPLLSDRLDLLYQLTTGGHITQEDFCKVLEEHFKLDIESIKKEKYLSKYDAYYFETKGQDPDVTCIEYCRAKNDGAMIGSAACQECEFCLERIYDKLGDIAAIKCSQLDNALGKT